MVGLADAATTTVADVACLFYFDVKRRMARASTWRGCGGIASSRRHQRCWRNGRTAAARQAAGSVGGDGRAGSSAGKRSKRSLLTRGHIALRTAARKPEGDVCAANGHRAGKQKNANLSERGAPANAGTPLLRIAARYRAAKSVWLIV